MDQRIPPLSDWVTCLPLLLDFCEAGLQVMGFDIDQAKVSALQKGESYIGYIPGEIMESMYKRALSIDIHSYLDSDKYLVWGDQQFYRVNLWLLGF